MPKRIFTINSGSSRLAMASFVTLALLAGGAAQAQIQLKPAQLSPQKTLKVLSAAKVNLYPYRFEVSTVAPSKIQGKVKSSGVGWYCKGNTCTTNVKYAGFGVTACQKLALKVGQVRSFRLVKQPPASKPVKGYPFNANKITRCNQGLAQNKSAKLGKGVNTGVVLQAPVPGQNAKRAKAIGEAGARMKQAMELQRMQGLGSPVDQAMGKGAGGRQDCSRSANRAKCLRDNMNADKTPAGPSGGGMSDCLLAGGNLSSCVSRGRGSSGSGAGRVSNGPGSAADGANIPGRGQAQSGGNKGDGSHWGQWRANPNAESGGDRSMYRQSQNDDGTESFESVTTNSRTGRTTREIFTFKGGEGTSQTTITDRDGNVSSVTTQRSLSDGSISSESKYYDANGRPVRTTTTVIPPDSGEQSAPDSASGDAPDNCNWNPALGKCMTSTPDPKDNTSQPGPDGESTGGILGRNAPKTDVGAAINCGDSSTEACNQVGNGLNNGAKRLDMKDDNGPVPGASPQ
jgi:hypothetical protein